jgi:transposase
LHSYLGAVPSTSPVEPLRSQVVRLAAERDEYKRLYLSTLEICRRLERGLLGQKRERFVAGEAQAVLPEVLKLLVPAASTPAEETTRVPEHTRAKPTGRHPPPGELPRVEIETIPLEVQHRGLDAFERIGEDRSQVIERRTAAWIVVETVRPKFVPKASPDASPTAIEPPVPPASLTPESTFPARAAPLSSAQPGGRDRSLEAPGAPGRILQAPAPELPIPRGMAGPGLMAETIVRRWQDSLPLNRLEQIYTREGLPLAKSTIGQWHGELAQLVRPLVDAMWKDALEHSPYLCVDATGVLVLQKEKCRRGHFFVTVAPERHVLFAYSPEHTQKAVSQFLDGYRGFLVLDAHVVYEHLFREGATECGCWAHVRRYFFKALLTDEPRARRALTLIQKLFLLEREYATSPPDDRRRLRQERAKPIVAEFFALCDAEALSVLDHTPIAIAIRYARNQREALQRFLDDGRLPCHNNISERALRRQAVGRKAWLFVGSDRGGEINATWVSLLASCQMHGLEPLGYLRDLFIVLPGWPISKVLELAPMNWKQTSERPEVKALLDSNVYRQVHLGLLEPTS